MAFNPAHTTNNCFISYPASDSDDQLKLHSPKELEIMEPEYLPQDLHRNASRCSFSSDDSSKQLRYLAHGRISHPRSSRPQSAEEESKISYSKYDEPQEMCRFSDCQTSQPSNYRCREFENDDDSRYCADIEMLRELSDSDLINNNNQPYRPIPRRTADDAMEIENEEPEFYNRAIYKESKTKTFSPLFKESPTIYRDSPSIYKDSPSIYQDAPSIDDYDDESEISPQKSNAIQPQFSLETSEIRMNTTEEISNNNMMVEPILTENYPQYLQISIRKNALKLRELIEVVLQGEIPQEVSLRDLNDIEQTIISCIIEKKFKNMGTKNSKRREEKQKLFFKSALKFIENNFLTIYARARNLPGKKDVDPITFYSAYFQETADMMKMDISNFLPPNQKRKYRSEGRDNKNKTEIKSFNLKYIELILSSKRFLIETWEFLENNFVKSYAKMRYQKIDNILEKVTSIIDKASSEFLGIQLDNIKRFKEIARSRIYQLLLHNSKAKLPWSNAELEEAKEFAREIIEKISQRRMLLG